MFHGYTRSRNPRWFASDHRKIATASVFVGPKAVSEGKVYYQLSAFKFDRDKANGRIINLHYARMIDAAGSRCRRQKILNVSTRVSEYRV